MDDVPIRFLGRAGVVAAGGGDVALAVEDVTAVLALMRRGEAAMVPETTLPFGDDPRHAAYALPARVGGRYDALGLKWTAHRHPAPGAVPGILSLTLISDGGGTPRAIVESALLTATRTAAVSALALRHLATAPLRRVALLGAGAQARAHLAMLDRLFPGLEAIAAWNRTPERLAALAAGRPAGAPALRPAATVAAAVDDADAVIACTASPEPLLDPSAVVPGRLILQIGYHEAAFAAIDAADAVVVDLWGEFRLTSAKSLFRMHREGRFAPERIAADLAAVVLDGWRPPARASVYFSSFGLNVFDVALAARVAAEAEARSLGTPLLLSGHGTGDWPTGDWPTGDWPWT